ncbi:hypothetical protein, partial [Lactovum miscens]|uniref:hypothetical protein n=1 Tax=Lactovum miscens TaxID=190387 RepID=UPI001C84E803
ILFYFIFPNSSIKVSGVFFLLQVANLILQFAKIKKCKVPLNKLTKVKSVLNYILYSIFELANSNNSDAR